MSDWQPIESAPKDGVEILLCDARQLDSYLLAYWDEEGGRDGYHWISGQEAFHADAWTHWQPLPPPPTLPPTP